MRVFFPFSVQNFVRMQALFLASKSFTSEKAYGKTPHFEV